MSDEPKQRATIGFPPYPKSSELSPEKTKAFARKYFLDKFGHYSVDVPTVTDAAGIAEYTRYSLKDFIEELQDE